MNVAWLLRAAALAAGAEVCWPVLSDLNTTSHYRPATQPWSSQPPEPIPSPGGRIPPGDAMNITRVLRAALPAAGAQIPRPALRSNLHGSQALPPGHTAPVVAATRAVPRVGGRVPLGAR